MADIDESESKPKILVIGGGTHIVGWLNKQKELSFVFSDLDSDFKDCQGILLYPPHTLSGRHFEDVIDLFEEDVSRLGGIEIGGIEGAVLYVWVDESDQERKEELVKMLRLEERVCVWGFGAGSDPDIAPIMDKFFNDNAQTNLKPAKREKRED